MIEVLEQYRPHQVEMRRRLMYCCLTIALTSCIAYLFKEQIASWCMQPLYMAYPDLGKLVYTNLMEAFISYLKLSLLTGLIVSFPFILYQAWLFIAPGLRKHEQQLVRRITLWGSLLFAGGALFAFFIVLPTLLAYFMSYAGEDLTPMIKIGLYLTFIARTILAFALAFEIPFLMVMATRTGLLARDHFQKNRTYFYIAILVLAFLLAAGDPVAALLISLPLFVLYETGILAGRIFANRKTHQDPANR
ncbi:twin-arginine translocase subunit TatC [Desulfobulbus alkaliphilus]|uniref:twin-arginine translocase subunit TatC n=1 Tax=Desulfobulbus alkaliphilus TaxID=869814 RepID=UPI0019656A4C|nr:twin-arginine translocase subunit TatC [Desulfobulbus alkaliphilus]MBM9535524.1 twin-arginine translocase subunit TatC [Desulfobulbus alkaliphilus]